MQQLLKYTFINFAVPLLFSILAGVAVTLMASNSAKSIDQREAMVAIEDDNEDDDDDEEQVTIDHCFDDSQVISIESDEGADITTLPIQESQLPTNNHHEIERGAEDLLLIPAIAVKEKELKYLQLKIARIENLGLKLDAIETKQIRHAAECWNNLLQVKTANLEVRSLHRKVRMLHKSHNRSLSVIRRQAAKISLIEEQKQELNSQVTELQSTIDQMEMQNQELRNKFKMGETNIPMLEKYQSELDNLGAKVEQLQQEKISELAEVIYLRWVNACLRYEVFKNTQEQSKTKKTGVGNERSHFTTEFFREEEKKVVVCNTCNEWGSPVNMNSSSMSGHEDCTKPALFQRLKKWVKKEKCRKPVLSGYDDQEQFSLVEDNPGRCSN